MLVFIYILLLSKTRCEYVNVDEIPLNYWIPKRQKYSVNVSDVSNQDDDIKWLDDALRSIAYYLRAHKFNEHDRRYEISNNSVKSKFYLHFPKPPLRSLHWEVNKFCEPSFLSCVEYLKNKIKRSGLKREDDTSVVVQEQQWDKGNFSEQIAAVEAECKKLRKTDDERADPFEGPIERFQWRTTASYYMCWYTMNEIPNLRRLNDNCDNFASCLSTEYGAKNNDPRAEDSLPFRCAVYSFCPDPCCSKKHLRDESECLGDSYNPCFKHNTLEKRSCTLNRTQNRDLTEIILNHWNVTCHCEQEGFTWDSRYGICIDVDECSNESHKCKLESESCINLPGSYECVCRWGYSLRNGRCEPSPALSIIKMHRIKSANTTETKKATSIVKRIFSILFYKSLGTRNRFNLGTLSRILFLMYFFN